jgi:hypothetical protein
MIMDWVSIVIAVISMIISVLCFWLDRKNRRMIAKAQTPKE